MVVTGSTPKVRGIFHDAFTSTELKSIAPFFEISTLFALFDIFCVLRIDLSLIAH